MPANHFEAKLHALRRARDGVVVSFVVHPDDVTDAFSRLAVSPLGQRYMIAYSTIGDDEGECDKPSVYIEPASKPKVERMRRKFDELPLPQQVAIRCQDAKFIQFVKETYIGYEVMSQAESDDVGIVLWVKAVCDVSSRSEIVPGTMAAKMWLGIMDSFDTWLTDRKYADSIR